MVGPAHLHNQLVHRAHIGEQGKKQHGEGGGHNQVGHIDDRLEEGLPLDLQPGAGEKDGQQQGNDDLGDGAAQPQSDGVAGIFQDIDAAVGVGSEERDVVLQPHKVWTNLGQALPVIFKKAVVDGQHLGGEVENCVGDEKGGDKDVAPLGVADTFAAWGAELFGPVHGGFLLLFHSAPDVG